MERSNCSRQHHRISVSEDVLVDTHIKAVDLSESGMLLRSSQALTAGKSIKLTLSLDGDKYEVESVVRWSKADTSIFETGYLVGVEFQNHSISAQLAIRAYIDHKMS